MKAAPFGVPGGSASPPVDLESLWEPGGPLQAALGPRFEPREQQRLMAQAVERTLTEGGVALLEAGTGTGKSLAYLIPLLLRLKEEPEQRAVVSTHTIPLQEQLLQQDLPVAEAATGVALPTAVAKGWGNYLCRLRLRRALEEPDLFDGDGGVDRDALGRLSAWEQESATGSRSELPEEPPPELWQAVAADPDRCTRRRCPFYEPCFYFQARRRLHSARLIVANHHLLMADLVLRRENPASDASVLPDFDVLVLDEAHHLEEVASDHLGVEVSLQSAVARLLRLARNRRLPLAGPAQEAADALTRLSDRLAAVVAGLGRPGDEGGRLVRLTPELRRRLALDRPLEEVLDALQGLADAASRLSGAVAGPEEAEDDRAAELVALARWSERTCVQVDFVLQAEDPQFVFWAECAPRRPVVLRAAPLDVGPVVGGELLGRRRAAVLTSATLGLSGDFTALRRSLGLPPAGDSRASQDDEPFQGDAAEVDESGVVRVRVGQRRPGSVERRGGVWEGELPSPFDLERQALLGVPVDLPDPDAAGFVERLVDWTGQLASGLGGRTFVLFTSYRMLEQAAAQLTRHPAASGLTLLVQGSLPRSRLLERFRAQAGEGLVVLGTDSFWEGVDVPGPALSCVVLARLPFPVPDHPVAQARAERLRAQNLNPFWEDALPRAVVKFRQGFGRLIRSAADRGCVGVADRRLVTRPYGRRFLDALPPCRMVVGPAERVLQELVAWCDLRR